MKSPSHLSRHDFLKISIRILFGLGGVLGLGGLVRFFSYQYDPSPPSEFDLGDADNFPEGSRTIRGDIPAVIYNQAGEIIAYSLSCTHLGCTVEAEGGTAEGFACPCHGSRYTPDGKVLRGPAQKPLRRLRVERQADNTLKLYTDQGQS
jgi:cytochrome b6-f complex iron-sulfur subunit